MNDDAESNIVLIIRRLSDINYSLAVRERLTYSVCHMRISVVMNTFPI